MSAIAAPSPPPSYDLTAQIQSWSSDFITFTNIWARRLPGDIEGPKFIIHLTSQPFAITASETDTAFINLRIQWLEQLQQLRSHPGNRQRSWHLIERFFATWDMKSCSDLNFCKPLLIIWWLLKPKVVFYPPQPNLHCVSSQLQTVLGFAII